MIICVYSLVISVPIKQSKIDSIRTISDSQEIKYEKGSDVANRLLNESTNETFADQESQEDDIEYIPVINDFYPIYDDEESSSEINDVDDVLPIDEQELIKFLEEECM